MIHQLDSLLPELKVESLFAGLDLGADSGEILRGAGQDGSENLPSEMVFTRLDLPLAQRDKDLGITFAGQRSGIGHNP